MTKPDIAPGQLEDAAGIFGEKIEISLGGADKHRLYRPDNSDLPRPSSGDFFAKLAVHRGLLSEAGMSPEIKIGERFALQDHGNLRVTVGVPTRDNKLIYFPGVILPASPGDVMRQGGLCVGFLSSAADVQLSATDLNVFSALQQGLLDDLYLKHTSNELDHGNGSGHSGNSGLNVAEISHASMIAVSAGGRNIHRQVHDMADTGFARTFAKTGNLDFNSGVNGGSRQVRSEVVPVDKIYSLHVFESQQPPAGQRNSFDLRGLSSREVSVGLAMVSALTRGITPDIVQNTQAMAEGH